MYIRIRQHKCNLLVHIQKHKPLFQVLVVFCIRHKSKTFWIFSKLLNQILLELFVKTPFSSFRVCLIFIWFSEKLRIFMFALFTNRWRLSKTKQKSALFHGNSTCDFVWMTRHGAPKTPRDPPLSQLLRKFNNKIKTKRRKTKLSSGFLVQDSNETLVKRFTPIFRHLGAFTR